MGASIRRLGALLAGLALAWLGCVPAAALDPQRGIAQYKHTRWTVAEGAPPVIYSLAQGKDGYLWIGSAAGLYRFDGVTFEHIQTRDRDAASWRAMSLMAARDGAIWVGYHGGEIGVLRNGVLQVDRSVPRSDSFASALVQTRDGTIWAGFFFGRRFPLLRRAGNRWEIVDAKWGFPQEPLETLIAGRDGTLWITTDRSLLRLREGTRRVEHVATIRDGTVLSEDSAGRLWLSDQRGSRPFVAGPADPSFKAFPTPDFPLWVARTRFDKDGNLWGINGRGLFRVRGAGDLGRLSATERADRVERIDGTNGLTATSASDFLEDREGNIWVGTTLGLDQFRNANVVAEAQLAELPDNGFGMLTASDGTVYLSTATSIFAVSPHAAPRPVVTPVENASHVCEDSAGDIWAFTGPGIFRLDRKHAGPVPPSPAILERREEWRGCAIDDRGGLWANATRGGMLRFAAGRWQEMPLAGKGEAWLTALIRDRRGRLLGLTNADSLVRVGADGGQQVLQRLKSADVHFLYDGEHSLFVGGINGLGRIRQGRFQTLDALRYPWLADIYGMAQTPRGETWLLGGQGIVRVATSELERLFDDPQAPVRPLVLGFDDGMPNVRARSSQKGVLLGDDGRLWFATVGGLVWVDPARITRNLLPPPVAIRAFLAEGVRYRDPGQLTLARGTSRVAIQYAGLSLAIPARVRFRYRLEGVDRDWIDAGSRREAIYTNLGPGTYRFRVVAANNDGVWNREGATMEFTIPPTFFQSLWFKLLLALAAILLIALAYRIRLRQVTARLQSRFDARIAERERIARELHDTLLQGFQGLMMRFQAVTNRVPARGGVREDLEKALEQAETVLVEGRARVRGLRRPAAERELPDVLRDAAAAIGGPIAVTVEGTPRPLHPLVREEALAVAEEAMRNAVQHAAAAHIAVSLRYGARDFALDVQDDGAGPPDAILAGGQREGHFGLVGMRERAARIDGRLSVGAAPGGGTLIRLTLSERAAYARRPFRWFARGWQGMRQ